MAENAAVLARCLRRDLARERTARRGARNHCRHSDGQIDPGRTRAHRAEIGGSCAPRAMSTDEAAAASHFYIEEGTVLDPFQSKLEPKATGSTTALVSTS